MSVTWQDRARMAADDVGRFARRTGLPLPGRAKPGSPAARYSSTNGWSVEIRLGATRARFTGIGGESEWISADDAMRRISTDLLAMAVLKATQPRR
jgi:hypothetical protein